MTRTMPHYDADEAKKELLATLHASRDLGPEMDDALIDRFIERLGVLRPQGSFDPAKTRADLESLLNSARGSDPAGDDALITSFLAGIQPPQAVPAPYTPYAPYPAYGQYGPPAPIQRGFGQVAPLVVMATVAIVALALTQGHAIWFMWFLIPMFLGWGRRNSRYQRRYYRDQRRAYRHNRIMNRDDAYPPSGPPEIL